MSSDDTLRIEPSEGGFMVGGLDSPVWVATVDELRAQLVAFFERDLREDGAQEAADAILRFGGYL